MIKTDNMLSYSPLKDSDSVEIHETRRRPVLVAGVLVLAALGIVAAGISFGSTWPSDMAIVGNAGTSLKVEMERTEFDSEPMEPMEQTLVQSANVNDGYDWTNPTARTHAEIAKKFSELKVAYLQSAHSWCNAFRGFVTRAKTRKEMVHEEFLGIVFCYPRWVEQRRAYDQFEYEEMNQYMHAVMSEKREGFVNENLKAEADTHKAPKLKSVGLAVSASLGNADKGKAKQYEDLANTMHRKFIAHQNLAKAARRNFDAELASALAVGNTMVLSEWNSIVHHRVVYITNRNIATTHYYLYLENRAHQMMWLYRARW